MRRVKSILFVFVFGAVFLGWNIMGFADGIPNPYYTNPQLVGNTAYNLYVNDKFIKTITNGDPNIEYLDDFVIPANTWEDIDFDLTIDGQTGKPLTIFNTKNRFIAYFPEATSCSDFPVHYYDKPYDKPIEEPIEGFHGLKYSFYPKDVDWDMHLEQLQKSKLVTQELSGLISVGEDNIIFYADKKKAQRVSKSYKIVSRNDSVSSCYVDYTEFDIIPIEEFSLEELAIRLTRDVYLDAIPLSEASPVCNRISLPLIIEAFKQVSCQESDSITDLQEKLEATESILKLTQDKLKKRTRKVKQLRTELEKAQEDK